MIKLFITGLLFWFIAEVGSAQPLKQNLPFSNLHRTEQHISAESLSKKDFRYQTDNYDSGILHAMRTQPGVALLGSAIVPGLGQAANKKWIRAGLYFAADILFLAYHLDTQRRAERLQRDYEQFADNNWSVVNYAQWLVEYHRQNNIQNAQVDDLASQVEGETPAYDTSQDWNIVDLSVLRDVERNTPFVFPDRVGNNFSHVLPEYGSQQYYELISKYYQFGPGWKTFGVDRDGEPLDSFYQLAWNGQDMPPQFLQGSRMADHFNDTYRSAGNLLAFLILNHVVSAFDALITVKVNNKRLEAESNFLGPRQFSLKYRF